MSTNKIFEIAKSMDGKFPEGPGIENNPDIVEMFKKVTGQSHPDSVSWCAAAVGSILIDAGFISTGSLVARSYLDYGVAVDLKNAIPGDIVVFWRESRSSWKGHVGIFSHVKSNCIGNDQIYVYGGNQDNSFCLKGYSEARLLSIRRPTTSELIVIEPDRDDVVHDLPVDDDQTTNNFPKEAALNKPWENKNTSIVIDAYQGNSIDWDEMDRDPRVKGVIHRFAYGMNLDDSYEERKQIAKNRGYLWGAYHLPLKGNTINQAQLFAEEMLKHPDDLMVLDLEDTTNGKFMTLEEAALFLDYVYEQTNRIPVIYANHSTAKLISKQYVNHRIFSKSRLWYARFKSEVTDFPAGLWESYFLWQFSCEINCNETGECLYNVPGTRYDMDINVFYGPEEMLVTEWSK